MIQLDFSCAWVLFVFGIFWWFCMSIGIRIKHQIDIIQFATSPNLNMLEVAFREKNEDNTGLLRNVKTGKFYLDSLRKLYTQ